MRERQRAVRSDLVRDEAPWVELVEELGIVEVRDLLVELGVPVSQAAGMSLWLDDQAHRRRFVSPGTAINYRAQLRGIGEPPSRRGRLRAIPGYLKSVA